MPDELGTAVAALPAAYAALSIVQTAARDGLDPLQVADVHFTLGQRLGLDRLLTRIIELPRDDRWQTMARAALRDDLHAVHAQLTAEVLASAGGVGSQRQGAGRARGRRRPRARRSRSRSLRSICGGRADLARVSVGLRDRPRSAAGCW